MSVQPQSVLFNDNALNYTLSGSGGISGTGSLTKNGSGMLTLGGSNTYTGGTNVNQGVLRLAGANAVSDSTVAVNVTGGLTFGIGIGTFNLGGLAGSGSFALSDTGGGAVALSVGGNNAGTTFSGILSGGGSLAKTGSGMLTLGGNNQFTGPTQVGGGTLQIGPSGAIAAASVITVSNSSTLAVTASTNLPGNTITVSAGSVFNASGAGGFSLGSGNLLTIGRPSGAGTDINGNFTLGAGTINIGGMGTTATLTEAGNLTLAGGVLQLDLSSTGASDLAKATNLNLNGPTTINVNMLGGALSNGNYPLIDYSGSLTGSLTTLTLNGLTGGGQVFSLAASGSSPGELVLEVAKAPANLVWTGSQSGTWDTAALNWSNSGTADKFSNGDTVTFNDTAGTGASAVTLNMSVQPQSVLFNSNALNYTLSGSGGISGVASLTKNGSGMLTLGGNNTYSGGTNINQGVLQLASANAVSDSTVAVNANGGLTFGTGIGTFNLGGLAGSGSFALSDTGGAAVALKLGSNNANTTFSGILSGGGSLVKTGSGTLTLGGNNQFTGATQVSGGTLVLEGGSSSSSFTANNGGTLQFNGASVNLGYAFVRAMTGGNVQYQNATLNGGFFLGPGAHTFLAGSTNNLNATTINNGAVLRQNATTNFTDVTNAGQITNNSGANSTWLGGFNAASGAITVNNAATVNVSSWYNDGIITVNNGGLLNNSVSNLVSGGGSQIFVNSGGTLNADSNADGVTLDLQGSLLVNNGTVTGTTNVEYGATAKGSGKFGLIDVSDGGMLDMAASASFIASSLTVSGGSLVGAGQSVSPATVADATIAAPNVTDTLTLSGDLSGAGPIVKNGAGLLILSGTDNSYGGGTAVDAGTLLVNNSGAMPDGGGLIVGAGGTFLFDPSAAGGTVSDQTADRVVAVPEPGTMVLLLAGAGFVAVGAWRRRAKP